MGKTMKNTMSDTLKKTDIATINIDKKGKKKRFLWLIPLALILILAGAFFVYVNIYYHADDRALAVLDSSDGQVTIEQKDKLIAFVPKEPVAGIIFYPGAKVEEEAYAPLMRGLADEGILCVTVRMPWRLAVLKTGAADGIREEYPEVKDWYMSGHSMGGAMASSYAAGHADDYKGIILLAAYAAKDISTTGLRALLIRGSEDKVLNMDRYDKAKSKLPEGSEEYGIEGGCHAGFGSYGVQKGDGTPTISTEQQTALTVSRIRDFILETGQ